MHLQGPIERILLKLVEALSLFVKRMVKVTPAKRVRPGLYQ